MKPKYREMTEKQFRDILYDMYMMIFDDQLNVEDLKVMQIFLAWTAGE